MKTKILILVIALGSVFTFSSCGKKGCTDADAENYCEKCKKDDGSCTYKATLALWWNQSYANTNVNTYGYQIVKVYIDGTFIDSKSASTYWPSAPGCSGGVNKEFDLGTSKTKSITIKLLLQGSSTFADSEETATVTLNSADACKEYQWQ